MAGLSQVRGLEQARGAKKLNCSTNRVPRAFLAEYYETKPIPIFGQYPLPCTLTNIQEREGLARGDSCPAHEQQMMVISSPLSDFLALWSSHCQVRNRPHAADSADPYYQYFLFFVARGTFIQAR